MKFYLSDLTTKKLLIYYDWLFTYRVCAHGFNVRGVGHENEEVEEEKVEDVVECVVCEGGEHDGIDREQAIQQQQICENCTRQPTAV